jgi:hypothetical protein
MDTAERQKRIEAMKTERLGSLEQHIATLEMLDRTTGFDFDIATDLDPSLIDDSSAEGRESLKFWKDLYDKLAQEPQYVVISKYRVGIEPGMCVGFGQDPRYVVSDMYVRIFEGLRQEDILFDRDAEGNPVVTVNKSSMVAIYHNEGESQIPAVQDPDASILFDTSELPILYGPTREGSRSLHARVFIAADAVELHGVLHDAQEPTQQDSRAYKVQFSPIGYSAFHDYTRQELALVEQSEAQTS